MSILTATKMTKKLQKHTYLGQGNEAATKNAQRLKNVYISKNKTKT
jgi:hypothetical protein